MISKQKKVDTWEKKESFFSLIIWVIGILFTLPFIYYFPLPSGHILTFHVTHPKKYPLGLSIVYQAEDPWCQTSLLNLGDITDKRINKILVSNGENAESQFLVFTTYRKQSCSYNIKSISLAQGTKEEFDNMKTKSLIDFYTRPSWKRALSDTEEEELFEKDKVSSLRICPNQKRQGHAENNSQFVYSLNGEKYLVNPEKSYGGPNRQLLINAPRKWDIFIEIGKINECEEANI